MKSLLLCDKPTLKGAWSESHDQFSIAMPAIISPERLKRESPIFYGVQVSNITWQLVKVLLRLTRDLLALFVQQQGKISTDTERRAGLSAIAEPLTE